MAHFVRCIEGHVFDAATAAVCPTCGARVEVAPSAAISGEALAPGCAPGAVFQARTPLFAAVAVLCLGIGIGSLYFVLHETRPPAATGGQPASAAAATAPAAPDRRAAGREQAVPRLREASAPTSTPTPATSTPDEATTAADANISQTLRTALDVVRMLVAFGQKDYANASSLSDNLIKEDNPIGMFIKAGLFMDGLGGQPKDLTQARALLAKATQLGDPTSALFYARVLENGIGGPRDLNAAKENYLFAARGLTAGADQDIARLHLSGEVGMTALQAYQNLVSPRRTKDALARFNDLMKAYSTSAVCLYGWMYSQPKRSTGPRPEAAATSPNFTVSMPKRWPRHRRTLAVNQCPQMRKTCSASSSSILLSVRRAAIPGANGVWRCALRRVRPHIRRTLWKRTCFIGWRS